MNKRALADIPLMLVSFLQARKMLGEFTMLVNLQNIIGNPGPASVILLADRSLPLAYLCDFTFAWWALSVNKAEYDALV